MSDQLRDKAWAVLVQSRTNIERVNGIIDLVNAEKSKSYSIGYQDGQRKRAWH